MSITTPTGPHPVGADEATPTIPTNMSAVMRHRYGSADTVADRTAPTSPRSAEREVLIDVVAAGLDRGVDGT